jgi:hypothetical protein
MDKIIAYIGLAFVGWFVALLTWEIVIGGRRCSKCGDPKIFCRHCN